MNGIKDTQAITADNYFTYTEGTFTPCTVPDREPDYTSKSSSYWYTAEGVIRQSDHWGSGIASCTWGLDGEALLPCHKNMDLGQRAGYIAWKDLRTPEKTLKVSHRFGDLDYERLGAEPLETGCDKFGDYDVFAIDRDWFEPGSDKYRFAGREIKPGKYANSFTSALGDAYLDPRAQIMSLDWEEERQRRVSEKREIPDVNSWIAMQTSNPDYGDLALELMGTPKSLHARESELDGTPPRDKAQRLRVGAEDGIPDREESIPRHTGIARDSL